MRRDLSNMASISARGHMKHFEHWMQGIYIVRPGPLIMGRGRGDMQLVNPSHPHPQATSSPVHTLEVALDAATRTMNHNKNHMRGISQTVDTILVNLDRRIDTMRAVLEQLLDAQRDDLLA